MEANGKIRHAGKRILLVTWLALISGVTGACDSNGAEEQSGPSSGPHVMNTKRRSRCDSSDRQAQETPFGPFLADTALPYTELHDCQRLILRDTTYGPLAGIWAPDKLASFTALDFRNGVVAAEIISYDEAAPDYEELGIRLGTNCLWLQRSDQGEWSAAMRHPLDSEGNWSPAGTCADSLEQPDFSNLQVNPVEGAEYPTAARWGWDPETWTQTMGVRCLDAAGTGSGWCEVGIGGFQPAAPPPGQGAKREGRGWYDEQYLAYSDGDTLKPSTLKGTIIPVDRLEDWDEPDFRGSGKVVATIRLEGDLTQNQLALEYYAHKFDLDEQALRSALPAGEIKLWLIRNGSEWQTRFQLPGGPLGTSRPAILWNWHQGKLGLVRWKWNENDEGTWVPCASGCCVVFE
ncbi:MAG: hypothetical protein HY703_08960 [Gemmatimonadetes bacterium]|nr:hypothetical protein [Gemmatimonadota bacterium]